MNRALLSGELATFFLSSLGVGLYACAFILFSIAFLFETDPSALGVFLSLSVPLAVPFGTAWAAGKWLKGSMVVVIAGSIWPFVPVLLASLFRTQVVAVAACLIVSVCFLGFRLGRAGRQRSGEATVDSPRVGTNRQA